MMLFFAGSASGPMFDYGSISQSDFTGLSVPLHRPLYGWECVDTYVVIAESSNGGSVTGYVNVTNPRQLLTVVSLSGMDMCKNRYFITAFTVTDANNGQNFSLAGFYPANYSGEFSCSCNNYFFHGLS